MAADRSGHDRASGVRLTCELPRGRSGSFPICSAGDRIEAALDDELHTWVNELTDRYVARGLSREEARRQALIETGGIEVIKENVREAWLGQGIETACQDVRYAFRSLRRAPGFTSVVIVTLALGMGASLTMFSLMRGVLWRPLPYPEPDRIVTIQVDARNVPGAGATRQELLGIRNFSRSFERVATIDSFDANLEYAGEMEHRVGGERLRRLPFAPGCAPRVGTAAGFADRRRTRSVRLQF